jgi:hypothetical protein
MRSANKFMLLATATLLVSAIPVLGQGSPESILPPGFGDPVESPKPGKQDKPAPNKPAGAPASILPDDLPDEDRPTARQTAPSSVNSGGSGSTSGLPQYAAPSAASGLPATTGETTGEDGAAGENVFAAPILQDLPPHARRSTDRVGVLATWDGDMGANAFGPHNGTFLTYLMKNVQAPLASRWGTIVLRRALTSKVDTPTDVAGADFVAERAWLLLRMGEAEAARQMVQAVDSDQYTLRLRDVAMQAALANADPAALCPGAEGHPEAGKDPYWMMSRAICSAFSGETSLAGALIDQVQDRDKTPAIDSLLAEKVVGSTRNTRRSINILWEDVNSLSTWRYGLATATALKIPDNLMATVGRHVRAWRAKAPLLSVEDRLVDADYAAALGAFSSATLVDTYAEASESDKPPQLSNLLGQAYTAASPEARLAAMKTIWADGDKDSIKSYARLILTARAAAGLPVDSGLASSADQIIAAMLTAGLDVQAARWSNTVRSGSLGWALLLVGLPQAPEQASSGDITGLDEGKSGKRAQFFAAALAGLGRIDADTASTVAETLGVPIAKQDAWTKAITTAARFRSPAAVALLAGVGLQGGDWSNVRPSYLFHIVAAMRQVGMEAEARMIAAEALTRS